MHYYKTTDGRYFGVSKVELCDDRLVEITEDELTAIERDKL